MNNRSDILLNNIVTLIKKSNLSSKSVGFLIRVVHFTIPVITVIIMLIGTKTLFLYVFTLNIIIYILFALCDGCILSKLEYKLTNDDYTVIDPFLEIFKIETTNKNRKRYSKYSSLAVFLVTLVIYYIRFR